MATTGDEYSDCSGSVQRGSAEMGSRVPWVEEEECHELQKISPTCDASMIEQPVPGGTQVNGTE